MDRGAPRKNNQESRKKGNRVTKSSGLSSKRASAGVKSAGGNRRTRTTRTTTTKSRGSQKQRQVVEGASKCAVAGGQNVIAPLHFVHFEVFGKVQRVFMRKYTVKAAKKRNVLGWVQNTSRGTVIGDACGREADILSFQKWLRTKGSPKSKIDRVEFTEQKVIESPPFIDFSVRKVKLANGTYWA